MRGAGTIAVMVDEPEVEPTSENDEARLDAYDVNHDGHISPLEDVEALLGVVDARLEQIAEEPGLKGKIADAAHKIVDHLDND